MPDPSFAPFTSQHLLTVLVGTGCGTALILAGRRGGRREAGARAILAFLNLSAFVFTCWAWSRVARETDLSNILPLHLCDLASITAGFALLTGNRTCALLTYFWGLAGTVQGIATPALDIGFPHPAFLSFFSHHFAVVTAALYLPLVLRWRPRDRWWAAALRAFAWLNAYLVVALVANHLLGTNFGFLAGKPDNPSLLDHLGPHPVYLLWLELIAAAIFLLLALPFRRKGA